MTSIEVTNISKSIGKIEALHDISLRFESGKIYGLIGRNGSGKTMLLRMLAGLIKPTAGSVRYDGETDPPFDSGKGASHRRIGITIETPMFYQSFTGLSEPDVSCVN
jgi:ABC-2 type transport system ATP-binding protein